MRWIGLTLLLAFAATASACGSEARSMPPEEEVSATWTAGDDERLDEE